MAFSYVCVRCGSATETEKRQDNAICPLCGGMARLKRRAVSAGHNKDYEESSRELEDQEDFRLGGDGAE